MSCNCNPCKPITSAIILDEIRVKKDVSEQCRQVDVVRGLFNLIARFIDERQEWVNAREYQMHCLHQIRAELAARFDAGQPLFDGDIDDFMTRINDAAKKIHIMRGR